MFKDNNYNFAVLNNFGIEMNNSIKNFDYTEKDKISYLLSVKNLKKGKNCKLKGKNIVITGKLIKFKNRNELKNIIEQYEWKVAGSISSKTNILINNYINISSSKNKTAKENGIPIISETEIITHYWKKKTFLI